MVKAACVLLIEGDAAYARRVGEMFHEASAREAILEHESRLDRALERLRDGFDAILLDPNLAEEGGIEAFRRVQRADPEAPVIILTGPDIDSGFALQMMREGAQDHLPKLGLDADRLHRAIRQAIERKLAERETARLAALSEQNPNPIIEIEADGRIGYMNRSARTLLAEIETTGKEHVALRGVAQIADGLRHGQGTSVAREVQFGRRWFEQKIAVGPDARIRVYMSDRTERKHAEERVQRSEARFRSLVETAGGALVFLDSEFRILEFNAEAERIFDCSRHDAVNRNFFEWLFPAPKSDALRAEFEQVLEHGSSEGFEGFVRSRRGVERALLWNARRLEDSTGTGPGLVAVGIDVTERRRSEMRLREEEQRFKAVFQDSMDVLLVVEPDSGRIAQGNRALRAILGHHENEIAGKHFATLFPEEHRAEAVRYLQSLRNSGQIFESRRLQRADGSSLRMDITATMIPWGNGRAALVALRDVSEREKALADLRESELRYALAARGANDGLWDWDLKEDRFHYGPRWKAMLGIPDSKIGDRPSEWFDRVHPDDLDSLRVAVENHVNGISPHFECEYRIRAENGTYLWALARGMAVREGGRAVRMAGSQTDITERKRIEAELLRGAFHDQLTGLANRALFMERLARRHERARGDSEPFAVVFFDLDRFKKVNEAYGHAHGDDLLRHAGRRILERARDGDTVARFSEDVFVCLLERIDGVADAARFVESVQAHFRHSFRLGDHEIYCTLCAGIALGDGTTERPDHLVRDADTAMHRAKAAGTQRYAVFDPAMHENALRWIRLETELRGAVHEGRIVPHYQPIVALDRGCIVGFEALARWPHPQRGMVRPDEFIPVAEQTGLIDEIGRQLTFAACERLAAWNEGREVPLYTTVNVSAAEFLRVDLAERTAEAIRHWGIEPRMLGLELTESVLVNDPEVARRTIEALRELGVPLYLDDFGTGFSSLGYLQKFRFDVLKIDRSFTGKMEGDPGKVKIVRTIIDLAHNLGMSVVAEGVETDEQLALLRELGCDRGQGYRFSPPVPPEKAEALLKEDPRW